MTSVVTGKGVSTHGFFEWFTYDSKINEVFTPFLFDYEGKEEILPKDNLFKTSLKKMGYVAQLLHQVISIIAIILGSL